MSINIGIIGTGGIVEHGHADAISSTESANLWSFLSRDLDRAQSFSKRFQAQAPQPAHDSFASFLDDPGLDAVIIATPDKLHAEQAVRCASAGKHILLEKPMATDPAGLSAIIESVEHNGITLGLCYRLRWHVGHRQVVSMAHDGRFGELRHVRTLWSEKAENADNWRASSELGCWWSLAAVGTHCLDLARWVLRPKSGEVQMFKSVISREVWKGPHDETAVLGLKFDSGATSEICTSFLFNAPTRLEIYGSEGFAICEDTFGRTGGGRIWTHEGEHEFENSNPFVGQTEDFVRAVLDGTTPEVDHYEGARNVELLLQVEM